VGAIAKGRHRGLPLQFHIMGRSLCAPDDLISSSSFHPDISDSDRGQISGLLHVFLHLCPASYQLQKGAYPYT